MEKTGSIPTPVYVRWQRVQHRLVPFVAVVLCAAVAWRLWRESPRITAVGQVDAETVDARAPAGGTLIDLPAGKAPRLFESVTSGQVIARIENDNGKWTDITAPMSGQIVKIQRVSGQAITLGQAVCTIASDQGQFITTYLRADQRAQPAPGMTVDVRQRADAGRSYRAVVERVGPQYEPVPPAQLRDRKAEEWGVPVTISMPAEVTLKPGELVYIGWYPRMPGDSAEKN